MKKLLTITALLLSTLSSASDEVSILLGGWSDHQGESFYKLDYQGQYPAQVHKLKRKLNETHNMLGIEYKNIIVAHFTNSYYDDSYVVAYNFKMDLYETSVTTTKLQLALGVVSGYDKHNIVDNISPYVLPNLETTVQINDKFSVSINNGLLIDKGNNVLTTSLKVTYSF